MVGGLRNKEKPIKILATLKNIGCSILQEDLERRLS